MSVEWLQLELQDDASKALLSNVSVGGRHVARANFQFCAYSAMRNSRIYYSSNDTTDTVMPQGTLCWGGEGVLWPIEQILLLEKR